MSILVSSATVRRNSPQVELLVDQQPDASIFYEIQGWPGRPGVSTVDPAGQVTGDMATGDMVRRGNLG